HGTPALIWPSWFLRCVPVAIVLTSLSICPNRHGKGRALALPQPNSLEREHLRCCRSRTIALRAIVHRPAGPAPPGEPGGTHPPPGHPPRSRPPAGKSSPPVGPYAAPRETR